MSLLRSDKLTALPWIDHGFGTKDDGGWTPDDQTARLRQVHGKQAVSVKQPGHHGDGDALVTAAPGVWLAIRTADCVPLLMVDPVQRVVAAIHAGWRGTAAQIASEAVAIMSTDHLCRPENMLVTIGPCIGSCCFAVGPEVAAEFPGHIARLHPQPFVDLVSANRQQLLDAGIVESNIEVNGLCTVCHPEAFHSFRRDRGDGRMVSAIRILPE